MNAIRRGAVKVEPVVASNPTNYSGTYHSLDYDFVIRLRVASDGMVEGSGEDGVFIDRASCDSPDDRGVKVFGLGVLTKPILIACSRDVTPRSWGDR